MFGESLISGAQDDSIWIADTDASLHKTKARNYFTTYTAFERLKLITMGNKSFMMSHGQDDINIEKFVNDITLRI